VNNHFSEVYYLSGVNETAYQAELEHQLRKMTIGISVGLVKQSPVGTASGKNKYYFDPYTHFKPDMEELTSHAADEEDIVHKYRICEVKPPSIEKVRRQGRR
jgi:hypothetical protein